MSILNVFITPEEGLVGVDTESVMPDGSIHEAGKMIAVPAAGAVIAFRGTDYVLMAASPSLVCFGGTLEQLAEWIPDLFRQSFDYCRTHYQATEEALGMDLALVGYSEAEERVVGHLFRRAIDSEEIRADRIHTRYRSPLWSEEDLPPGIPADRPGMIALAQHQSRLARERMPEFAAGGRFLIAEVRRHSISIEKALDFPPRQ
ncbi:MAG: hypothetical protein ACRERX_02240 [Pseudomonas sp.]